MEKRRDDACTTRPDRVAERDRPAVDVDLREVEAELATVGEDLGRERLVDLDEIERVERQLDPIEEALDALDRGEEQPLRRDLGLGVADDPGQRREAELLDCAFAGDDPSVEAKFFVTSFHLPSMNARFDSCSMPILRSTLAG